MKDWILFITVSACFISCLNVPGQSFCQVRIDSLLHEVDTNQYELIKYPNEDLIEVLDKPNAQGARGIFKFDSTGHLRFYAFLDSIDNGYNYSITYDTVGKKVDSTGGDVVKWYLRYPENKDFVEVTFFLCSVEYNFGSVAIEGRNFSKSNIKLFETDFLKLIGAKVDIPINQLNDKRKIIITGVKQSKCTKQTYSFKEILNIPFAADTSKKIELPLSNTITAAYNIVFLQ